MTRKTATRALTAILIALLIAGVGTLVRDTLFRPKTITAYFVTATAIYPGDHVRVAGVEVGTVTSIDPEGTQAKLTMAVAGDVPVPADARAVIVAQNLISARYIQLTPPYEKSKGGPQLADGAVIPVERTAVPVEWDEVKDQLTRLATELGPKSGVSSTSVARFIDSAAGALDGNGAKLRETLTQLAGVSRVFANGGGDIADIITNLQIFVGALRDSNEQIVQFQGRLASLTSVLDDNKSDLDAALTDLSDAVDVVRRFIAGSRNQTAEQLQRLANVTQNLVDHKVDLENILHVAPNAIANAYNIYNPDTGSAIGSPVLNNLSNPLQFVCAQIGAIENVTAPETAKLCAQYLGPALKLISLNNLPVPLNPFLKKSASPENIVYSEARLMPGGEGPKPEAPEPPPPISAYTGLQDNPYPLPADVPPPFPPGPSAPDHLPAYPSPALYPGAPVPTSPSGLPEMMLPAEIPSLPAPESPAEGAPASPEGTPPS